MYQLVSLEKLCFLIQISRPEDSLIGELDRCLSIIYEIQYEKEKNKKNMHMQNNASEITQNENMK